MVKNPPVSTGDAGSLPDPGRSPGGGNGNPFHYSCLENPTDRGVWWATVHRVAKNPTWLSSWTTAANPEHPFKLCVDLALVLKNPLNGRYSVQQIRNERNEYYTGGSWKPFLGESLRDTLRFGDKKWRKQPRLLKAIRDVSKLPILKLVTAHSQINWSLTHLMRFDRKCVFTAWNESSCWATVFHKWLTLDRGSRNLMPFHK